MTDINLSHAAHVIDAALRPPRPFKHDPRRPKRTGRRIAPPGSFGADTPGAVIVRGSAADANADHSRLVLPARTHRGAVRLVMQPARDVASPSAQEELSKRAASILTDAQKALTDKGLPLAPIRVTHRGVVVASSVPGEKVATGDAIVPAPAVKPPPVLAHPTRPVAAPPRPGKPPPVPE